MCGTWTTTRLQVGLVHVCPDQDVVAHDLDEDCVCGPRAEPVPGIDGFIGWMHVHHSLDGREAHEQ